MGTINTFGTTVTHLNAEFADYDDFGSETNSAPTIAQVTSWISDVAAIVCGHLLGQSIDPANVAADEVANRVCRRMVIDGVASLIAPTLRGVGDGRREPHNESYTAWLMRLSSIPGMLGDAWSGKDMGHGVAYPNFTNPDANALTDFNESNPKDWLY